MITKEHLNQCLTNSKNVAQLPESELRELVDSYPYCELLQWLYLKQLSQNDDVRFEKYLHQISMQISNRRQLYYYLLDEKEETNALPQVEQLGGITSDYFGMMKNESQRISLQELAAKLKEARLARAKQINSDAPKHESLQETTDKVEPQVVKIAPKMPPKSPEQEFTSPSELQFTEDNVKKCIKERQYSKALEILQELNLRNPKKSAYFASQIKFVQTILENNK